MRNLTDKVVIIQGRKGKHIVTRSYMDHGHHMINVRLVSDPSNAPVTKLSVAEHDITVIK